MKNFSEKFNHYLTILVHAFTWQTLIVSIMTWNTCQLTAMTIVQYFLVSLAVTALMAVTDIFTLNRSLPVIIITGLLDVSLVVFGLGGFVFNWFAFEWLSVLTVLGSIALIYFIIFGFIMLRMKKDSEYINQKIKERLSKENSNDE